MAKLKEVKAVEEVVVEVVEVVEPKAEEPTPVNTTTWSTGL
jgi:hypothetical protein